jgi:hypothetical protein
MYLFKGILVAVYSNVSALLVLLNDYGGEWLTRPQFPPSLPRLRCVDQ